MIDGHFDNLNTRMDDSLHILQMAYADAPTIFFPDIPSPPLTEGSIRSPVGAVSTFANDSFWRV